MGQQLPGSQGKQEWLLKGVSFEAMKISWDWIEASLYNTANEVNATKLHTLKW